jgi:sialic acid synthase SpsE
MPVFEFDEMENKRTNPTNGEPLCNYWGYSTVGFFAPKAGYAATGAAGMQVDELKAMVRAVRNVERALGTVRFGGNGVEEDKSRVYRRSLFVVEDIPEGGVLTRQNVRAIRPGHGLAPRFLPEVLGRRARVALGAGTPLRWSEIA